MGLARTTIIGDPKDFGRKYIIDDGGSFLRIPCDIYKSESSGEHRRAAIEIDIYMFGKFHVFYVTNLDAVSRFKRYHDDGNLHWLAIQTGV